ncbi:DUF1775 domain-containing protein [Candidatus Mycolicibacterium alkanivorans]|uniref:YcnI family protein n=1 Tax=Candidatus Mycolicibacterium alkanivorans TaxID=2954114 RepID=A0ABS9YSK7_9MYCO|nr:DUF1775 domain-containing protein [Candidatus Mycolicibacterium alkanivorans]MCI4674211.1 YcnI family protein [Candidatus Mycolicibacterium alkanivorans]
MLTGGQVAGHLMLAAYRSVTFTATPGAGIGTGQFELFPISIQLPNTDTVAFPAVQTYADGSTVRRDQPPLATGDEPEFPAPALTLTAGPHDPEEHHANHAAPRPRRQPRR